MVKLCKDCKHCKPRVYIFGIKDYFSAKCNAVIEVDLVTGEEKTSYCKILRHESRACGEDGKLWKLKENK